MYTCVVHARDGTLRGGCECNVQGREGDVKGMTDYYVKGMRMRGRCEGDARVLRVLCELTVERKSMGESRSYGQNAAARIRSRLLDITRWDMCAIFWNSVVYTRQVKWSTHGSPERPFKSAAATVTASQRCTYKPDSLAL